ncbi:MAG: hypothetical protein ABI905_16425 [Betaproteobacteria bacterium]
MEFQEYRNYQELSGRPAALSQLIASYQNVFGEPDVWAENYTHDEVDTKLQAELAGSANLRLYVDDDSDASVAGFFWVQMLHVPEIVHAIGTIKFAQAFAKAQLRARLYDLIGPEPVIYIHDLGIQKAYRGRVQLTQLICPSLWELARRTGVAKVMFWSVPGTQMSAFARRAGFDKILVANGMHFYVGELAIGETFDGVNLPWRKH